MTEPLRTLLPKLDRLAAEAPPLWGLPAEARVTRVNVSENVTYLVETEDDRAVLRIHRDGYHSRLAIESELAWSEALRLDGRIRTPAYRPGEDGAAVQVLEGRRMVLFDYCPGPQPSEDDDLVASFTSLGEIAAATHEHSQAWRRPEPFERLTWDLDAVFGPAPTWGDWRNAPGVDEDVRSILEKTEALTRRRIEAFGTGPDRFGLIHADMRLANLIIGPEGPILIDFDDCGFGWFLYDFAAAISFIEDHPQVPALRAAWVEGYRRVRRLSADEEVEIDSFIMLRRMALLAWIGSHIEAPEPKALAPRFAAGTARIASDFLRRFG